jgi:hypothetical protein
MATLVAWTYSLKLSVNVPKLQDLFFGCIRHVEERFDELCKLSDFWELRIEGLKLV